MATVIDLAPSILSANFAQLGADAKAALDGGGTVLHLDVMDGHFVPNLTIGPPVVASLRKTIPDVTFDCHLMIENADEFIPAFAEAGANWISVHQEACVHLDRTLHLIESHGCRPGVVINPATPVHMLDEVLEIVHHVLVMSVNPGFGAQHFIPNSLKKVETLARIRETRGLEFRIEIDGGVALDTVGDIVRAGAEILVAGNAVFSHGDIRENARKLLQAARSAVAVKASPRLRRASTAPRNSKSDRHRRQT
ncbi:MAG TPA: ribulose-phosphate 3-epimerase [Candidatus Binatus sp.]|nr:ribulose-phosphate 3-epimerase [Candidatus Binatus sp.]